MFSLSLVLCSELSFGLFYDEFEDTRVLTFAVLFVAIQVAFSET